MKAKLVSLFAVLYSRSGSFGENAIFLGSITGKLTSSQNTGTQIGLVYTIFERTNSQLGAIAFFKSGTVKQYAGAPIVDMKEVVVSDDKSVPRTWTVITRGATTPLGEGTLIESALYKGQNVTVELVVGQATQFPKAVAGTTTSVFTGSGATPSYLTEIKTLSKLQRTLTLESNAANGGTGEDLNAALQRIKAILDSQGYSRL